MNDNLSDFSFFDESDESDEEQIESVWTMLFENVFFEGAISKMPFFFNTHFMAF